MLPGPRPCQVCHAFFNAQARALLVSHWQEVYSDATVQLVGATVRELEEAGLPNP
jgi:hypothetical protein